MNAIAKDNKYFGLTIKHAYFYLNSNKTMYYKRMLGLWPHSCSTCKHPKVECKGYVAPIVQYFTIMNTITVPLKNMKTNSYPTNLIDLNMYINTPFSFGGKLLMYLVPFSTPMQNNATYFNRLGKIMFFFGKDNRVTENDNGLVIGCTFNNINKVGDYNTFIDKNSSGIGADTNKTITSENFTTFFTHLTTFINTGSVNNYNIFYMKTEYEPCVGVNEFNVFGFYSNPPSPKPTPPQPSPKPTPPPYHLIENFLHNYLKYIVNGSFNNLNNIYDPPLVLNATDSLFSTDWDGNYPISITYLPKKKPTNKMKWVCLLVPKDQLFNSKVFNANWGSGWYYKDLWNLIGDTWSKNPSPLTQGIMLALLILLNAGYAISVITSDANDTFNTSPKGPNHNEVTNAQDDENIGYWDSDPNKNISLKLFNNLKNKIQSKKVDVNEIVYAGSSSGAHFISRLINETPNNNDLPFIKYAFLQSGGTYLIDTVPEIFGTYTKPNGWDWDITKYNKFINFAVTYNQYTNTQVPDNLSSGTGITITDEIIKQFALTHYGYTSVTTPTSTSIETEYPQTYSSVPDAWTEEYYMRNVNKNNHPPVIVAQAVTDIVDSTAGRTTFAKLYFKGLSADIKKKSQLLELKSDSQNSYTTAEPRDILGDYTHITEPLSNHGWCWQAIEEFIKNIYTLFPPPK